MGENELILCDTNILIELYKENQPIINFLKLIGQENISISVVSSEELIYGACNKRELLQIQEEISHLNVMDIDKSICSVFIELMSMYSLSHKLMLSYGLIAATAIVHNLPLFTLNKKDFRFIKGLEL